MKRVRSLSAVVAIVLMGGCASTPPPPDEAHQMAGLLANYERLATLKTEEQRREFIAAQAAYDQKPNDTTRLNLALAMLLPRAPWRDDARVQVLLSGVEATAGEQHSARHDLAQLLLRLLAERQRAQRDEQRKADQLANQVREERRKVEEMQQKIESLRAIDRETQIQRKAP
jgi:outer membrane murein-binding lipoprotein Lpp